MEQNHANQGHNQAPQNSSPRFLTIVPSTSNQKFTPSNTRVKNSPLFQVKNECAQWIPLTDTKVRRNFFPILSRLGMQHSGMSLHTFRRSGATLAFNSDVSIQNIQSHGTWTSDCVWRYITQDHNAAQQVADSFKNLLHRP